MTARSSRAYRVFNLAALVHLSLVLFVFGIIQPAAAQSVRTQWVARVNGLVQPPDNNTATKAITGDRNDNVYVTGQITISKFNTEAVTIKYDPFGKVVWKAFLTGRGGFAQGQSIAVDSAGSTYVLGSLDLGGCCHAQELFTAKYNPKGVRLWIDFYEIPPSPNGAIAGQITTDKSGNVYVTGNPDNHGPWVVMKYNSNGKRLWAARSSFEIANGPAGLVVDGQGNVYVTGSSSHNSAFFAEAMTVKYDVNGKQLWLDTFQEPLGNTDVGSYGTGNGIALDSAGNAYVAGNSQLLTQSGTQSSKALLIKYRPDGKRLWLTEYQHPSSQGRNQVNAFVLDSKGNAFLAGSEFDAVTNVSNYSTLKFDSNGKILWERLYNGPGMGPLVSANAIALDPSGAVYVTGQSTSPDGSSFTNLTTVKYDTNGNQKWAARYQGPLNGGDTGVGVTYLSLGKLAVTGDSAAGSTGYGWVTIGYTQF
jgi:Beta-propeller repeat